MKEIIFRASLACLLLLPMAVSAQTFSPRINVDYSILATPQPVYAPKKGTIEVAEVFSFACPHCASVSSAVSDWVKVQPFDVNFVYVPSVGQAAWERFARGFYAAEAKKIEARSHEALFQAVFVSESLPHDASLEQIAKFYSRYGVASSQFLAIMTSPGVDLKLNRSKQFTIRTGANSTPTIIVAGKYKVNVTRAGGPKSMLATVDFLIAKERAANAAHAAAKPVATK